jgi:hypothetical protein
VRYRSYITPRSVPFRGGGLIGSAVSGRHITSSVASATGTYAPKARYWKSKATRSVTHLRLSRLPIPMMPLPSRPYTFEGKSKHELRAARPSYGTVLGPPLALEELDERMRIKATRNIAAARAAPAK